MAALASHRSVLSHLGWCSQVDGKVVKRYKPGDYFGEQSLLSGQRWAATVVAAKSSNILVIDRPWFDRLS